MSDPRPQDPFLATEELPARSGLPWSQAPGPHANGVGGVGDPSASEGADPGADSGDPDAEDLDLLDQVWTPPRRVSRFTVILAAGVVAALGFAGGGLVQKQHDAGLAGASNSGAAAARSFARANGFGGTGATGGFGAGAPGTGGTAGSGAAGSGAAGSGGTGSGGSGAASGTPVVVGTVVSVGQGTLVVQNFAGAKVSVHVPAGTPVTAASLTGLRAGMTVSVTGTKAADGTVTATSVSSRSNG
jgi:hypothetical protein